MISQRDLPKPSSCTSQFFKRISEGARWAYMHLPINGSLVTGYRYPHIPRLYGNSTIQGFFTGRLEQALQNKGVGFDQDIQRAAQLAAKHPRGMCYFWLGHKMVLLVTQPSDVRQVLEHHEKEVSRVPVLETFINAFGKNILSLESNSKWREKRVLLKNWLFEEKPLEELAKPMQQIIDDFLNQHFLHSQNIKLEQFFASLAMDVIARSRLGTQTLASSGEVLPKALKNIMSEVMDQNNAFLLKMTAIRKYLTLKTELLPTEKAKIELHKVFKKFLLEPNADEIRDTKNLLKEIAKNALPSDEKSLLTFTDQALSEGSFLLLAGHETTSKLLQFTLMLLADCPSILSNVRAEIEDHIKRSGKSYGEWTREDVKALSYLNNVLRESLRLYPPVPLIARAVTKGFSLSNIPSCSINSSTYKEAMANKNSAEDIILSEGDIIVISPFVTHRLETLFKDPLKFIPERFDSSHEKIDPYSWFPFGIGERSCIGRFFALQEAALVIARLVMKYDISIGNNHHPFTVQAVGTLRAAESVQAQFTPRLSKT